MALGEMTCVDGRSSLRLYLGLIVSLGLLGLLVLALLALLGSLGLALLALLDLRARRRIGAVHLEHVHHLLEDDVVEPLAREPLSAVHRGARG